MTNIRQYLEDAISQLEKDTQEQSSPYLKGRLDSYKDILKQLPVRILDTNRKEPITIVFKDQFEADDFVEVGMKALLTKVEFDEPNESYTLHFDFEPFYNENLSLFKRDFIVGDKEDLTAIEAGFYNHKYTVTFDTNLNDTEDEEEKEIREIIELI